MKIGELKHRLAQGLGAKGYPPELRAAALAYAVARRAEGARQAEVAKELGVSDRTLLVWGGPRRNGRLTPVKVLTSCEPESEPAREPAPAREVVVECGPIRVLGLDVSGVADLLRRLG